MTNVDDLTMHAWPHEPPREPPTRGYPGASQPPSAPPPPGGLPGGPGVLGAAFPGGDAGIAPPAPPHRRPGGPGKRGLVITGVVLLAIALLAGAFVVGSKVGRTDDAASVSPSTSASAATPTTKPPSSPSSPPTTRQSPATTAPSTAGGAGGSVDVQAVKAEVATLQKFVEKDRGLTFKNDVDVTVLANTEFEKRVAAEFDKGTEELRTQGQLLQSLGLIPANADPVAVQKKLLGSAVQGFYDPVSKALVVRGDDVNYYFREIVVHELTHALDDQHFNLNRPEIEKRTDGSEWAWLSLIEGSARRVEYDYVRQLSTSEKAQLSTDMQSAAGPGAMEAQLSAPLALLLITMSPYDYGEPFVRDVLARHGQAGLDRAFTDPPTTSEQILQPEKYESREGAKAVEAPPSDGEKVQQGTLGEIMTGFLVNGEVSIDDVFEKILGGGLDPNDPLGGLGNIDPNDPLGGLGGLLGGSSDDPTKQNEILQNLLGKADKVKNWGGDTYVLYKTGSDVCVKVDWTMDSPADVQNLRTQLDSWAQKDGKGKIDQLGDKTRLTRCASGAASSSSGSPGDAGKNS